MSRLKPFAAVLLALLAPAAVAAEQQQSLLEPLPEAARGAAAQAAASSAPASGVTPAQAASPGDTQRLSQLFYQLQILQQEVQELRGLVEEQAYQLNRLQRDQQEQYIDLDRRMAELTTGQPVAAGRPGSTATAPSTGAPAAPAPSPTPALALGPSGGSERDAYTRAFELMKARDFEASAAAFNQLIVEYPNGQYTPNAFYWLGELYLAQTKTEEARQSFAQVLNLYPDHPKVPDTLYKMGVVYHRLGDSERAVRYFEQVQREHPSSSAAGLAARYRAELQ